TTAPAYIFRHPNRSSTASTPIFPHPNRSSTATPPNPLPSTRAARALPSAQRAGCANPGPLALGSLHTTQFSDHRHTAIHPTQHPAPVRPATPRISCGARTDAALRSDCVRLHDPVFTYLTFASIRAFAHSRAPFAFPSRHFAHSRIRVRLLPFLRVN